MQGRAQVGSATTPRVGAGLSLGWRTEAREAILQGMPRILDIHGLGPGAESWMSWARRLLGAQEEGGFASCCLEPKKHARPCPEQARGTDRRWGVGN